MMNRARVGEARSAHISADGEMLAVGLKNGGFVVLNANNFKLWGQRRDRGQMINDIRCASKAALTDIIVTGRHTLLVLAL